MFKKLFVFVTMLFMLNPLLADSNIYRFQVNFATGSSQIQDKDISALVDFSSYMNNHPTIVAEIQGHTDAVGNEESNQRLSQSRADAVSQKLVSFGVNGTRIRAVGYGKSNPIADNATEEGRYQNRRVEAHLTGNEDIAGQSTVTGQVLDAKSSTPLSVVTVQFLQSGSLVSFATTDDNGNYNLNVKPGSYQMLLTRNGYVEKKFDITIPDAKSVKIPVSYISREGMVQVAPSATFFQSNITTETEKTRFKVKITDNGGGIGKIELYNNGVRINPTLISSRVEGNSIVNTYDIGTPVGSSAITVLTYDKSNSSTSEVAKLKIEANYTAKPTLHTLIIGIDRFDNPKYNLNFTDDDAKLMKDVFNEFSTKLFDDVKVTYLVGQPQTIKQKIIQKLQEMKTQVAPNDYFVFYVSSHGSYDALHDTYYLVPSNMSNNANLISEDELANLMADIDTRYKLVLFDTCHSGKATQSIAAALMRDKTNDVTTIAASKTQEVAMEGYKGHGIFTYILAEGLQGAADVDQNKRVTSIELAHYIQKYLPTLSQQRFHKTQNAVANYTPRSFDITLLDERYKPEHIVPVEFKKEELPQLLSNLDTQNVSALNSFYAEHTVQVVTSTATPTTTPAPSVVVPKKEKPKKQKSNEPYKAPMLNIGLGGSLLTGAGAKVFTEIRPSENLSFYLNAQRTNLFEMSLNGHSMPSNTLDSLGAALRYRSVVVGYDKILSHKSDNKNLYIKKAKSALMLGLRDDGKDRLGGGFYYKQYDSEDIYGENMHLFMFELTYKLF